MRVNDQHILFMSSSFIDFESDSEALNFAHETFPNPNNPRLFTTISASACFHSDRADPPHKNLSFAADFEALTIDSRASFFRTGPLSFPSRESSENSLERDALSSSSDPSAPYLIAALRRL